MKQYTRIAFDIDNCLTVLQPTLDLMADHVGMLPVVEDDVRSFRLSDAYGISREEELDFWHTRESELCSTATFALKRVSRILEHFAAEDCQFLYVTNRDECYLEETVSWLVSAGLPTGKVVLLGKNSKMETILDWGAEAVFEDNPSFFLEWQERQLEKEFEAYCIGYPYNTDSPCTERINRMTGKTESEEREERGLPVSVPKSFLLDFEDEEKG